MTAAEFAGDGALLHSQRMQQIRGLFNKGVSGWAFSPTFTWDGTDQELARRFGGHNHTAVIFRDNDETVVGCRLVCQCDACQIAQSWFAIESRIAIVGLGAGSYSVMLGDNPDKATIFQRERSGLEDHTEKCKALERQRDLAEKAKLAEAIVKTANELQKEQRRQFQKATGGLIRDKLGRTWTRHQLIAMCEEQQRELESDFSKRGSGRAESPMGRCEK